MSSKPSGLRGYPSAFAIGSHIAITSGVRTIEGFSSGTSGRSASKLSSRPHSEEAGDQATGSSRPWATRCSVTPEDSERPSTNTALPATSVREALKRSISGFSSGSFSGE
jgi:hypothetical protein